MFETEKKLNELIKKSDDKELKLAYHLFMVEVSDKLADIMRQVNLIGKNL